MEDERTLVLTWPPRSLDPAKDGWWARFKSSKLGRLVRVLLLPFILIASRIEWLLALFGKMKYATVLLSMFVSIGAYTLYWGLSFAVGFVLLLFVHEMGHVIQLRREGIRASAPFFIPFLGAVIGMREMPKHALAEARVGLAGPILGTVGALVALGVAVLTDSDLFRALAYTAFFLNLFNLLPVSPLDGGRAVAAISPWLWLLGMAVLGGFLFLHFNPFLLVIVLIGGVESASRLVGMWRQRRRKRQVAPELAEFEAANEQLETKKRQRGWSFGRLALSFEGSRPDVPVKDEENDEAECYYEVTPRARALVALIYVALAAVLVLGMSVSYVSHLPN